MSDIPDMEGMVFTTTQIAVLLSESIHKVQSSYVRRGLVAPSVQKAQGTGTKRLWNYDDLVRFFVIKSLKDMNLPPDYILGILREADKKSIEAAQEGFSSSFPWQDNRLWVYDGRLYIPWIDPSKYTEIEGLPTLEEGTVLEDLDYDKSQAKIVLSIGALHTKIRRLIRLKL
jgi:hypothetical protein